MASGRCPTPARVEPQGREAALRGVEPQGRGSTQPESGREGAQAPAAQDRAGEDGARK